MCGKLTDKSWKIAIFSSNFRKLLATQTTNGPQKYAFKWRAAGHYNWTHTLVILVISRAWFSVIIHLVHLHFFTKTWLPRCQFLRVCSLFLSILCLLVLYAKILEICPNRLILVLASYCNLGMLCICEMHKRCTVFILHVAMMVFSIIGV